MTRFCLLSFGLNNPSTVTAQYRPMALHINVRKIQRSHRLVTSNSMLVYGLSDTNQTYYTIKHQHLRSSHWTSWWGVMAHTHQFWICLAQNEMKLRWGEPDWFDSDCLWYLIIITYSQQDGRTQSKLGNRVTQVIDGNRPCSTALSLAVHPCKSRHLSGATCWQRQ